MPRPRKHEEFKLDTALARLASGLLAEPNYLRYDPMPHQKEFHESTQRRKLFIGGNRAGKTTGGLNEDVGWATKRHRWRDEIRLYDKPIRGRIVCQDFKTLVQVVIPGLKQWIPAVDLVGDSWETAYSGGDQELTFKNGSTIDFRTYDQAVMAHAGTSRHWIHFDEPPPKAIYEENLLRLLDTRDDFEGSGAWWMTYTPTEGKDWVFREWYEPNHNNPNAPIFIAHVSVDENTHISQEAKDEIFAGLSESQVAIRRHGKYIDLTGSVFKEWSTEHVLNPYQLHEIWGDSLLPPRNWEVSWSIDHGLNNATAIYWHACSPDGQIITFHERHMRDVLIKDHAAAVIDYEVKIGRSPSYRTGDPAMAQRNGVTGTSPIQEYATYGINIYTDSVPRDPSIGIIRMRQYMQVNPATGKPYWRIYDCPELDKELQDLHWATYSSAKMRDEKDPQEKVHKYKDHGFDSCKYFFTSRPSLAPVDASNVKPATDLTNNLVISGHTRWTPEGSKLTIIHRAELDLSSSKFRGSVVSGDGLD